jgi:hypothetical protein
MIHSTCQDLYVHYSSLLDVLLIPYLPDLALRHDAVLRTLRCPGMLPLTALILRVGKYSIEMPQFSK